MAKKRTYNTRLIKRDYSYTTQEICECLGAHKNTVRNWIKDGLPKIDSQKPFMIHGSDLIAFLNNKQSKRKHKCKENEMFCFKCRCPRKPKSIEFIIRNKEKLNIRGKCDVCKTAMFRAGSVKNIDKYKKFFIPEKQAQEHIIDSAIPTLNCYLEKDERHEEKTIKIQPEERAYQTDLFSIFERGRPKGG